MIAVEKLKETANRLVSGGGILAADDLPENLNQKLESIGIPASEESRGKWQQTLFTSPELSHCIKGVIFHEEFAARRTDDGVLFSELLAKNGILSGITLDRGLVPLVGTKNETTTQGLDDLLERAKIFHQQGFRFAKWRAAYRISQDTPSSLAIMENSNVLARYASLCQLAGLVPIVEPDVSMEGDHDVQRCQQVMEKVWAALMAALSDYHVFIEGIVLKTNMVVPGTKSCKKATPEEIGNATVSALLRTVPTALPGIGFLSGGQKEEEATVNLDAINKAISSKLPSGFKPWALTFCFGRALLASAFKAWSGENEKAAQEWLIKRSSANCLAASGQYSPGQIPSLV